jgi:type III secretion system YscD/HrpQ family protein
MLSRLVAEEGPLKGLVLKFEEETEWIIGRDPDECDFVLEDASVSRRHLRCTFMTDGLFVENLSESNPTSINGETFSEPRRLHAGDRVQIGHTLFVYGDTSPAIVAEQEEEEVPEPIYDAAFDEEEKHDETLFDEEEHHESEKEERSSAYDTIFEDGESNELPFPMLPTSPFLLKVISGPNAGAEIGLEKGRSYIIGKDPNSCDIAFQDFSVSKIHARLSVSAEGTVEIEDLDSKNGTAVNGILLKEKKSITQKDVVALGTTIFLVIDREAPQETIYSPSLPNYEHPAPEAPLEEEQQVEKPAVENWKSQIIPTRYLVGGGSIAVVLLVMFFSFFSLFKATPIIREKGDPSEEIAQALEKFKAVQFSFNPTSGKIFVVGDVSTNVDYQELLFRLDEIPFITNVEDSIVIDELLCKSMNDVISEHSGWQGITIQSPQPGQFIATGYLATNAEGAQFGDYITTHFPYLDRLTNRVAIEENINVEVNQLLIHGGFGSVTFQTANGEIVLSGVYDQKGEESFPALSKEIQHIPGVRTVKNFARATTQEMAAITLSQQYTISGTTTFDGRGYSIVLNGKIYTLGDNVDGMKLIAIEPATVLLEKDGVKYRIDYTR